MDIRVDSNKGFEQVAYSNLLGISKGSRGVAKDVDGRCVVLEVPLCDSIDISVCFYCAVILDNEVIP